MEDIKKVLFIVGLTLISVCGIVFVVLEKLEVEEQGVINYNKTNDNRFNEEVEETILVQEEIYVEVKGAINKPGVYKVIKGTRVFEVVELAGGLKEEADGSVVNLASELKDEDSIYFPTESEVIEGSYQIEENPLIDINRGNVSDLIQLTGIGESKAKSIISFREKNGDFKVIEDIMKVPGIKESLFEVIKDLIKV